MSVMFVYTTTDPRVTDSLDDYVAERRVYGGQIEALGAELFEYEVKLWMSGDKLVGFTFKDTAIECPPGWRTNENGHMVPHRGTKIGRAATERMEAISVPVDPRDTLLGMPREVWPPGSGRFYGHGLNRIDGAVYATWAIDPQDYPHDIIGKPLDLDVWQATKVSAYLAAQGL
jgi:hypothetical protein